jgi:hypothetical protein
MPELKELQHILMDNEKIIAAAPGRYFSGMALLAATDQRLLLVDKRSFFLTVEDTRYDMISEIDFSSRLYDATIHIHTLNKQHNFTSIRYKKQLRELTNYVQQRVWETRQYKDQGEVPIAQPVAITQSQEQAAPPASASLASLPNIAENLHVPHPHLPHVLQAAKPHLTGHIGSAAMNGSRRYSPNAYTNHLTARSRQFVTET